MGIIAGVLDVVAASAADAGATGVTAVNLRVGTMTDAIEDSLVFAFEALSEGTVCEGAQLVLDMVEPTSLCLACSHEFAHDRFHRACPACGSYETVVLTGRELEITSIEVMLPDDEADDAADADGALEVLRGKLAASGALLLDLAAEPRAGKTSTILAIIDALRDEFNLAVVLADEDSAADADRIRSQGIPAVQAAPPAGGSWPGELVRALDGLDLDRLDLVVVEHTAGEGAAADGVALNGAACTAVLLSARDWPAVVPKLGQLAACCDAVLLNKVDILPQGGCDLAACERDLRSAGVRAPLFPLSATRGTGVREWADWLADRMRGA